ncbi:MAG: adenylate/guanylate cyclase domain-containing protein, partial [Gammaproteobacteria bacterium]
MAEQRVQRRLAAILAADVVGYSRLMEVDEETTLRTLKSHREIIDGLIARHDGRIFSTAGDSVVAEFRSAVEAVRSAISIQEELKPHNQQLSDESKMMFRIGVNLGDIMVEGDNLYGDGVNVAARLEGLCAPGEVYVSGTVHDHVEGKLEVGFEDMGAQAVKNITKPVQVYRVSISASDNIGQVATGDALPLPDKPSIAVLAFENMSGDPEQEYFADGISEDIITVLSKISGIFVIARHSSFVYKDKLVSVKQVGRNLGVRYVLEGSVRKAGNRLRITAQLIDSETDHHLWAEHYDRELEDVFAVQDEVARKVADALEVALTRGESKLLAQAPTDNIEAYDVYLRARNTPWPMTRHNIRAARIAYERVIEIDPAFAGGYAGKSMMHATAVLWGYSDDREGDTATAFEMARRAVELDQDFA